MRDSIRTNSVKLDFSTRDVWGKIINNIHIGDNAKKHKTEDGEDDEDGFSSLYQFPSQTPFGQIRGMNPLVDIESQNLRRIGDEERQRIQNIRFSQFNRPMRQPEVVVAPQIQEFTNTTTDLTPEQQSVETVLPPEPGQIFETPVPPAFETEESQPEPIVESESRIQPQQKLERKTQEPRAPYNESNIARYIAITGNPDKNMAIQELKRIYETGPNKSNKGANIANWLTTEERKLQKAISQPALETASRIEEQQTLSKAEKRRSKKAKLKVMEQPEFVFATSK